MASMKEVAKEGLNHVIPERQKEWVKLCRSYTFKSENEKSVVKDALAAIKLLEEGKLTGKEIWDAADSGHSGFSWSIVEKVVATFSPRGCDFVREIKGKYLSKEQEEMLNEIETENKKFPSQNGGKEVKDKPNYIDMKEVAKEGLNHVIPERQKEWVRLCANHKGKSELDKGVIRDAMIAIKLLDEGKLTPEEVLKAADSGNSGASWTVVENIIATYSPKGVNFVKQIHSYTPAQRLDALEKLDKKNKSFKSQKDQNQIKKN